MNYGEIKSKEVVEKTIASLQSNGFEVVHVASGADAKAEALSRIPEGAEVMTMTSETIDIIGLGQELNESGKYNAVKPKLYSMDRATEGREMQRLGAAPEYSVGSVHAITENGEVMIASNSGSQLPGYAYGSDHVIWVVSTKKLVRDIQDGLQRINEYTLPLESERARKAYGVPGSEVKKLLIFNKEFPGRITIILVDEALGY